MKKLLLTAIVLFNFINIALAQPGTICWRKISAGKDFNLAIKFDGTLWGWGANVNQLGLGFSGNQNLPIQIGTANDWVEISAGYNHSLAIKTNGTLWSWGDGTFGALGNGAFASVSLVPTQVGTATNWAAVSAGSFFSLALNSNNELFAWGKNNVGQLGYNALVDTNVPNQVTSDNDWVKIDAGHEHSLGIRAIFIAPSVVPSLFTWGNNTSGELGDGTFAISPVPQQILATLPRQWSEVSAGFNHSLVLESSGSLFAFGNNSNGQLGNGSFTGSNTPILSAVPSSGLSAWRNISAGYQFSYALESNSSFWSWGFNTQGALGLGNFTTFTIPNQVGASTSWLDISAGQYDGLALDGAGLTLFSAGRNNEGQLGVGNFTDSNILLQIACGGSLTTQNNIAVANAVSVYPNPASTVLNIKSEIPVLEVSIYDFNGRIIHETNQNQVDVSSFSKGIYLMKIATENGTLTQKIIKE